MEKLNDKKLKKLLKGLDYAFFESVSSTFDVNTHDIVIAAHQTSGTGRLNRPFFSDSGGIYLCVKTRLKPLLTVSAAAGALRALEKHGVSAQVKWVNDIIYNGKKVAGILARAQGDCAVVGIGVNYRVDFPDELNPIAGSIKPSTKGINKFAADLVFSLLEAFERSDNLEYYKGRLYGLGREFTLPNKEKAVLKGVTEDGNLIYLHNGKEEIMYYGDIHL